MGLFKRGKFWSYDFWFKKVRYQGSTRIKNHEKAKLFLNAFRTNLALTGVGMVQKEPAPILSTFLKETFLDNVRQNTKKPRTKLFYENCVTRLCKHIPFTQLRLDQVDEIAVGVYKDARLSKKLSPATINGELRTLRKALKLADDCGLIRYRRVRTLPGERNRVFILDGELEKAYLAAADYPLRQVAILMLDLGLRPEEAVRLKKTDVNSALKSVTIRDGKTVNARRSLPLTARCTDVFELCFALFPDSEWVFPGFKGRHFTRGAIDNLHIALRKKHNFPADFVLYALRHTFGTRLAESGARVFEIKQAMGHSSVTVSEKYIHLTPDDIARAMKQKELFDRMIRGEIHEDSMQPPIRL